MPHSHMPSRRATIRPVPTSGRLPVETAELSLAALEELASGNASIPPMPTIPSSKL